MTSPSAIRMRRCRERRRQGKVLVEVFVTPWGVDRLISQGLLDASQRADAVAVRWAAQALLGDAIIARCKELNSRVTRNANTRPVANQQNRRAVPAQSGVATGRNVITAEDQNEWQAWRHERILTLQRERRKALRRIDYYPSESAAAIFDKLRTRSVGGDASSILNRIVLEWATIPELNRGK